MFGAPPTEVAGSVPSWRKKYSLPPRNELLEVDAEDQRVAEGPPENGDEAGEHEALRADAQHVLAPHQAAVEEGEAGQGHEQHQRGGGHHPAVMAGTGIGRDRRGRLGDRIDALRVLDRQRGIGVAEVRLDHADSLFQRGVRQVLGIDGRRGRGGGRRIRGSGSRRRRGGVGGRRGGSGRVSGCLGVERAKGEAESGDAE